MKIFLIDDEEPFCVVTASLLRQDGYDVDYRIDTDEALSYLKANEVDIVFLDIDLGTDISGLELLPLIIKENPFIQVVMLTSKNSLDSGIFAMKNGAFDYLVKPLRQENWHKVIPAAIERKRLKQLNQLYLEILVHDLKNPLQSITMGLDALSNPQIDAAGKTRAFNLSNYGCLMIQTMIANILNVTKLESLCMSMVYTSFNLANELNNHLLLFTQRIQFSSKEIKLSTALKPGYILKTDNAVFFQIVSNLLSNAIRFTRAGDRIGIYTCEQEKNLVEVSVSNSGSFIEEEFRDKIFDKFFKSQYHGIGAGQNFGLGLTFIKLAVQALGGNIRVESVKEPPVTTFYFTVHNHQ